MNKLYDLTVANIQTVGNKHYASIPVELIKIDPRIQRVESVNNKKVMSIVKNYNATQMTTLRVTRHDEEECFSCVDGMHRIYVAKILGISMLTCEICDVPKNDPERVIAEAFLFVTQDNNVQKPSAQEKHKSNLLLKTEADVILEELMNKYKIEHKPNGSRGASSKGNVLTAYSTALRLIKRRGRRNLDLTFKIICEAQWNINSGGFSDKILSAISNVVMAHDGDIRIVPVLSSFITKYDPVNLLSLAIYTYQARKQTEAITMLLENHLANMGMYPVSSENAQ